MKKTTFLIIMVFALSMTSVNLFAKCYSFTKGGEYKVCVPGDSFSDRNKAKKICSKAKGSDCGGVQSSSSSCQSNSGKCYDQNGKSSSYLSGY